MNYTQMANAGGQGGLSFGEGGDFGERYGYYVASVRRCAGILAITVWSEVSSQK